MNDIFFPWEIKFLSFFPVFLLDVRILHKTFSKYFYSVFSKTPFFKLAPSKKQALTSEYRGEDLSSGQQSQYPQKTRKITFV